MKLHVILLLLLLLVIASPASASDAGSIKNVEGGAWIMRDEMKIQAKAGLQLVIGDVMKTGDGAMGVILHDDTIISMGPRSEMVLSEFIFKPEVGNFALFVRFMKGTFSYLSGTMAKLSPESVKIETPVGMVAVRGTHFLVKVGR